MSPEFLLPEAGLPAASATRLQQTGRYATWAIALVAGLGFIGWLANVPVLASFGADFPPITLSGVLVLMATVAALSALSCPQRPAARPVLVVAVLAIAAIAAFSLAHRFEGVPPPTWPPLQRFVVFLAPEITSVGTAYTYLLLALAIACAAGQSRFARDLARMLAVGVAGIATVALLGLLFRIARFHLAIPSVGMALPVALALLAASFSLIALRPSSRLVELLSQDSPGAVIVRRLLPVAVVVPLLAGWILAVGERSEWFEMAEGEGIVTVALIAVITLLILWTSNKIDEINADRSKAEMRAQTEREWLEVTLANIGDAVITTNAEGRIGLLNRAAQTLLGIELAAAVGRPVRDLVELVDERSGKAIECPLRTAFARHKPVVVGGEPALRSGEGDFRPVDASATPIRDRRGYLMGGVLVLRDVSSLRAREHAEREAYAALDRRVGERTRALERAMNALRESTALLQTVAASTPELILAKSRDGRIMMVNPAALQTFGLSRAQVIGRRETELFGETDETLRAAENDRQVLESGEPLAVEETRPTRSGPRTFLVMKSPLRDKDGQVFGLVGVATDITERKRAHRELEQLLVAEHRLRGEAERASRAKDEFLAIVSHELRSPLNALKGWSHVLSSTANPDPLLVARAVDAIRRNVDNQTRLIDDLLDTSRIVSGKLELASRPVNLVEVVHSAIEVSRSSAAAKNLVLQFVPDEVAVVTHGDQGRLQQVVVNLLSNAIKFTSDGGLIEMRLRYAGDRIELTVADSGIGIDADFLPHVFDRFSQADTSMTRHHFGLGIGLALVRNLVELHGGSVRVVSPGPGKGSVFTVDLPAARGDLVRDAGAPEAPAESNEALGGVRVLILDDDPDSREVMRLVLLHAGAEAQTFSSSAELLRALDAAPQPERPTVLLLDIAMPGEDGFTVLKRVRERTSIPFIPAIAVTALTYLDRTRLSATGFQDYVGKPVDVSKLIQTILSVLGRKSIVQTAPASHA